MNFDKTYITDVGANIFANTLAINSPSIDWGGVYTSNIGLSSLTPTQIHQLTGNDFPSSSYTSQGSVRNVIVTNDNSTATVYCEVDNQSYNDGNASSLIVFAKRHDEQDYSLVMVAFCDAISPTYVPSSTEMFKALINFNVEIADAAVNNVIENSGFYASNAALQQELNIRGELLDRVVTTHAVSDTTSGDDQEILGNKTFKDNLIASTILPEVHSTDSNTGSVIGRETDRFRAVYTNNAYITRLEVNNFLFLDGNLEVQERSTFLNDVTVDSDVGINGDISIKGNVNSTGNTTINGDIYTENANVYHYLYVNGRSSNDECGIKLASTVNNDYNYVIISSDTDAVPATGASSKLLVKFVTSASDNDKRYFTITTSCTTSGNVVTRPSEGGRWVIGDSLYDLYRVYAEQFRGIATCSLGIRDSYTSDRNIVTGSGGNEIKPNGTNIKLGDVSNTFDEIHVNKVYTDEVHADEIHADEIHADSLSGILPSVETISGTKTIQVGCIFLGIVTATITSASSPTESFNIGDIIQPGNSRLSVYPATFWIGSNTQRNNGWKADTTVTIPTGAKFKALSSGFIYNNCTAPGMLVSNAMLALMMRIE